jgi:hypothetical protein
MGSTVSESYLQSVNDGKEYSRQGMYNQDFYESGSSKILLSPLANMTVTSGFSLYTCCKENTWENNN